MGKYEELSKVIIDGVGGKDNIIGLTHCMTRLRFELKNDNLINEKLLSNNSKIISTTHSAGKFQVIIGNAVSDVYDELNKYLNSSNKTNQSKEKENIVTKITNIIVKVITPTLNVLVAAGLLKGLLSILLATKLISASSGTYAILNAVGDSLFYFFPIILGYTSAEAFGLNKFIGMVLGGTLLYPALQQSMLSGEVIMSLFKGTAFESNAFATFFELPVVFPVTGYSSTVIPIILINYFASKVEKVFKKYIPDIVGFAFVPFLTLLISAPLGLIIIGPIANLLQGTIGWLTQTLLSISPILTTIVVALIYQPLVIFGLHWPLITLAITNFQTLGYDYLWPMMFTASFAQTAVVLAVGIKTKNKQTKSMVLPAFISGLMCIIEPAIYGFSLKDKKRFAFSCIGAAVGGVIITLFSAVQYNLGIGLFGFPGFINPADGSIRNMLIAIVAVLITMVISFLLTYLFFNDVDKEETINEKSSNKTVIYSPIKGTQLPIENISDKTFASEIMGKSIAIYPESNKIVAPCNGVVESLFPTGHAIGIVGTSGESLLIHIGLDTVNLNSDIFSKHIEQGKTFNKGDILITFDKNKIEEQGYDPTVIVTLTNSKDYNNIVKTDKKSILELDEIIRCEE